MWADHLIVFWVDVVKKVRIYAMRDTAVMFGGVCCEFMCDKDS